MQSTSTLVSNQQCEPCAYPRVDGQNYKALLVGIRGSVGENYPELKGSHKDVEKVQALLIDCYGYRAADITKLVDDGDPGHMQPTRDNILKAINDLVRGAKAGDRFCFHYSGHSMQIPNRSNSEEDGMDECLIPLDGVGRLIVDNELNKALVLPLPTGSQLVAVLDTCHSGSLLDLKHYRCNRVVIPWIWRGKRRSSYNEIQHNVVRRNGRWLSRAASILSGRKAIPPYPTPSTRLLAGLSEINMNLACQSSLHMTSGAPNSDSNGGRVSGAKSCRSPRCTYTLQAVFLASSEKENDGGAFIGKENGVVTDWVLPEDQRCSSPVAMFECDGWCRDRDKAAPEATAYSGEVRADVISLASCRDSQRTWEDEDGNSMTASLVEILRRNPNQSLKDVLVLVSHAMHSKSVIRHLNAKKYMKEFKQFTIKVDKKRAEGLRARGLDMENFQNPELSSSRPLDMERPFQL